MIFLLYCFDSPKKEVPMASLKRWGILAMFLFVCQMLLLIQTLPLQAEELVKDEKKGQGGLETPAVKEAPGVKGVATYYAKKYKGRKTQSGQRYNPEKLTAAHPSLPFGTKVKVVNLDNENEVVVEINDRCRKRKVHNIDLSRAAARRLGFLGRGMARVIIATLAEEPS
jgi:rare lipoprotein A